MNHKRSPRGIALVIVLLISVILMMMLVSLYISMRGETFFSQQARDQVTALYVAEAGVADAAEALGLNPGWTGVNNKVVTALSNGAPVGKYSIRFHSGPGPYLQNESVSNFGNTAAPADSFRGPATVPANSALVVVEAQVGMTKRTVEVIIKRGISVSPGLALYGSDKLELRGNVSVSGVNSLTDCTAVNTLTHSDMAGGTAANMAVSWTPGTAPSKANFLGRVSTVSANASIHPNLLFELSGANITEDAHGGEPQQSSPDINVLSEIATHSGSAPFNNNHSTSQSLSDGAYYVNGDLDIQGDLSLNNATVYVNGNVNIHGGINGNGSVYVANTTKLRGDSRILGGGSGTSVLSHGSIELTGFDGAEFLESKSLTDTALATLWNDLKVTNHKLNILVQRQSSGPIQIANDEDGVAQICGELGSGFGAGNGRIRDLKAEVAKYSGPTAAFVAQKLDATARAFDYADVSSAHPVVGGYNLTVANAVLLPDHPGLIYCCAYGNGHMANMTTPDNQPMDAVGISIGQNLVRTLDLNKIGHSTFQGLLYSHGAIYASHEVDIIGAIVAKGDSKVPGLTINGTVYPPGSIFIDDGCTVIYTEQEAHGFPTASSTGHVTLWLAR